MMYLTMIKTYICSLRDIVGTYSSKLISPAGTHVDLAPGSVKADNLGARRRRGEQEQGAGEVSKEER